MKELEVYVRSSPLGKTDFHWRKIENGESILGYPQILEQRIIPKKTGGLGTIEYLINYQKLSFLLMRHSQQLLFLVAGIEALEERSNQLGSTIYNAVAWVVHLDDESNNNPDTSNNISPENELMLLVSVRSLLSFVDKDLEFINTINEAINFKGLEEFEVNLDKINQLTENSADKLKQLLSNLDKAEGDQQNWYKKDEKIGNEQEIISLAEKIINTGLPEDDLAILISKVDKNTVSVSSIDLDLKPEIPTDNQVEKLSSPSIEPEKTEEKGDLPMGKSPRFRLNIKVVAVILIILTILSAMIVTLKVMENQKEKPEKIPIPQSLVTPKPPVPVNLR
ncbi:hypothetical protein [Planktothrix agardhii]|uniref:hypothetical protein n=1 Tax=Planktothrix agardhii TaxID=1160 RepID=UPI0020A82E90|nr:hypothetical protein [Planktothrix agardhii]CAD5927594.1 hypothetical protein NO365_01081 [Planktothrix agardhii]